MAELHANNVRTLDLMITDRPVDRNVHYVSTVDREGQLHPPDSCKEAHGSGSQVRQGRTAHSGRSAKSSKNGSVMDQPMEGVPDPVVHQRIQELRESGEAAATAKRAHREETKSSSKTNQGWNDSTGWYPSWDQGRWAIFGDRSLGRSRRGFTPSTGETQQRREQAPQ